MFTGFSPETIDFLWGIRMNNNREWFQAHKQQYVDTLYEPMKELGWDLFQPFLKKSGTILKVSRIYRDARLHHPVPYKESLWICIRQDVQWWAENPCLFFEIRPEGVSYGFSLWQPKVSTMDCFRQEIAREPGIFLDLLRKTRQETGIEVTGESYKRPKPAPSEALAPYWSWRRDVSCIRTEAVGPELFGPPLGERAALLFRQLTPLYEYFVRITNQ